MLDLLAEIWSSLPVLSSILGDWPPYSILAVSSWNRYKVRIVSCIAELLQMLGLAFLELFVIDWCCFYYFVRNSLVALLEALCARIFSWDSWISVFFAAINVANSFKISTCSWFLWGPRSRARLSLPNEFLCVSIPAVATRRTLRVPNKTTTLFLYEQ